MTWSCSIRPWERSNSACLYPRATSSVRGLPRPTFSSREMTDNLLKKMSGQEVSPSAMEKLTDRELEVFQMIGGGRTTREIAEILNLGMTTVDTYRTRIKEKLGLRNGTQLQHYASHCVQLGQF